MAKPSYVVKVGSRKTLRANIKDASGATKDLSDAVTYDTARWKVWKPDGTLVIDGAATFQTRSTGDVRYTLGANDATLANVGIWQGEIEFKNTSGNISDQTETFPFEIRKSY